MSDPHAPIHLTGPAETASAVPYLLGFHPHDSLVLIALEQSKVRLVVRLDLPDAAGDGAFTDRLQQAAAQLNTNAFTQCLLAGFGRPEPVTAAVRAAADILAHAHVAVLAAMRVHEHRVWTLTTAGEAQPPHGEPFDPATSVAAAAAIVAGVAPLPDRDAVRAQLTPTTGEQRAAFTAATNRARRVVAAATHLPGPGGTADGQVTTAALRQIGHHVLTDAMTSYRDGDVPDDRVAALLTVLLADRGVRELAVRHLRPEPWHTRMWIDLVRRAEPDLVVTPATLLTIAALLNGDGVLAANAVARALEADPDDRLALLLGAFVRLGIGPDVLLGIVTG